MRKHLGQIALSAALLGLVAGGVYAGSQAFAPAAQPKVQFVQPAAQTVEPSPTTTVAPSPTATVTPKPVESTTSATSAPKVVQKKVTVAEPSAETSTSEPTSTVGKVVTNPDGSTTIVMKPGQKPPVIPAKTPPPPPSS